MINLVVVSDIRLFREGMSKLLSEVPLMEVICEESKADKAIDAVLSCKPDVVLLDMRMTDAYKIITAFEKQSLNTKLIVLSMDEDETNVLTCAEAGISGYLSIDSCLDELVEAVYKVNNGEIYCPSCITKYLLRGVKKHKGKLNEHNSKLNGSAIINVLTRRERQVVNMMADGFSNKQIARKLTIEVSTVKNHVHSVLVKLDAKSRTQAVSMLQHALSV